MPKKISNVIETPKEETPPPKNRKASKREDVPPKVILVQMPSDDKPKRKRAPLSDEQKAVLSERLVKARAAKQLKRETK